MTRERTHHWPRPVLFALLTLLGGCSRDPYKRTDVWRPEGTNDVNLAAMVANPNDLIRGQSDTGPQYKLGTHAVEQLWHGAAGGGAAGGGAGASGAASGGGGGAGSGAGAGATAGATQ
jgi:type IV pilus biogenesis protein CpaD/CtpE